mgnify:CR=1 FL=1
MRSYKDLVSQLNGTVSLAYVQIVHLLVAGQPMLSLLDRGVPELCSPLQQLVAQPILGTDGLV